jgi:hypothetical protein
MSFYLRISIVVTSIGLSNPKLTTLWYCSRQKVTSIAVTNTIAILTMMKEDS